MSCVRHIDRLQLLLLQFLQKLLIVCRSWQRSIAATAIVDGNRRSGRRDDECRWRLSVRQGLLRKQGLRLLKYALIFGSVECLDTERRDQLLATNELVRPWLDRHHLGLLHRRRLVVLLLETVRPLHQPRVVVGEALVEAALVEKRLKLLLRAQLLRVNLSCLLWAERALLLGHLRPHMLL